MDYTVYKIIHFVGLALTVLSFGSLISKYSKGAAIGHGVGLLLVVFGGFGLQAKLYDGAFPLWIILKLVIWLLLGGLLVLIKRGVLKGMAAYGTVLGLVLIGVSIAVYRMHLS